MFYNKTTTSTSTTIIDEGVTITKTSTITKSSLSLDYGGISLIDLFQLFIE